jgi:4-hydroxybenzoate polyprenyltransferase
VYGARELSTLRVILRLARWPDWSASKLPYLGAAALLLAPAGASAARLFAMLATVVLWAAFGYGINDVADRDCDRRAGKENRAAAISTLCRTFFLVLTAGGAIGLTFLWAADHMAPTFVAGGLLLAGVYSIPPFRLKERGALGLVAGAASQWVLPVLALAAGQPRGWSRPEAWCLALLGLAIGIRWMAIHQLQDADADRRADVRTFAANGGRMWPLLAGAFAAEIVILAALLALMWPRSMPAAAALVFWIAQQALLRPRGESFQQKLRGYDHAPLAEYYFLLLPATLAAARALSAPSFLLLAAAFVALGWGYIAMMSGEWYEAWQTRQAHT